MRYRIASDELIVLRDGRPFGEVGTFGGTSLAWPLPQTLAGMCRTALGFCRDQHFFETDGNAAVIKEVGIARILPNLKTREKSEFLIPTPADLLFTDENGLRAHPLQYSRLDENEGTDLMHSDWLYPRTAIKEKPAPAPMFLRSEIASRYLRGEIPETGRELQPDSDVVTGPIRDIRIHSSIDPATYSVNEGGLFAESGILLAAADATGGLGSIGDLRITFSLNNLQNGETLPDDLYLGGDRKRVQVRTVPDATFPACPTDQFADSRFLKLVLTTHGDFGGWVPEWLLPEGDLSRADWVTVPATDILVRLRSAVISGWDPASGWDYAAKKSKGQPKPFRKLVRPGSVYLIELQDPGRSAELARPLWGGSLCPPGSQAARDGYGQVLTACSPLISDK